MEGGKVLEYAKFSYIPSRRQLSLTRKIGGSIPDCVHILNHEFTFEQALEYVKRFYQNGWTDWEGEVQIQYKVRRILFRYVIHGAYEELPCGILVKL